MNANRNKNIFGESRWRIIVMLRKSPLSVKELAAELDMTENGVRSHLAFLERDGLVRLRGVKQSGGKPAHIYEITEDAELLFPKGYGLILSRLIGEAKFLMSDNDYKQLLTETAKKLSRQWPLAEGGFEQKIKAGTGIIAELGGLAEIIKKDEGYLIQGYSCPLSEATKTHPDFCILAKVLLEELTGLKLELCCNYDDKPRCGFMVLEEA